MFINRKYLVMITGYNNLIGYTCIDKPVFKRTYYVTNNLKEKCAISSALDKLSLKGGLDYSKTCNVYEVKVVKDLHFKYTTKRIAKRRCK